jgi:glycine dehydrogenase subunit 1
MKELSEVVASRARYAISKINNLPGVKAPIFSSFHFKEFTVRFSGITVEEVNRGLLDRQLHGGKSLVNEFPDLDEAALYCVTELHTKKDLDLLVSSLAEVLEG